MKFHTIFLAFVSICFYLIFSCNANQKQTKSALPSIDSISFKKAENYFVKNTFNTNKTCYLKINKLDSFNQIFGMATTMHQNGKPTEINFSKEFVYAIIEPVGPYFIQYKNPRLYKVNQTLKLVYTTQKQDAESTLMQPCLLLIMDKQFEQDSIMVETLAE